MAEQKSIQTETVMALKNFRYAEEEFYNALDELERLYYLMDDHDENIGYVTGYLEQYGRLSTDECEIEERLVEEYESAKKANVSDEVMDKIYNKMRVIYRRIFKSGGGILYAILSDDGRLEK